MSDADKLSNALSAAGRLYDLGDTQAAYKRLSGAVRTFLEPGTDLCRCADCLRVFEGMDQDRAKELAELDTWAELYRRNRQAEVDAKVIAQYNPTEWTEITESFDFGKDDR